MILEFSEKGIVFFPDQVLIGTPADYGLEYEEVFFPAADGVKLHRLVDSQGGARRFAGSMATPATSATAWKISNFYRTWPGCRSSSSITGNTAAPRVGSAAKEPIWMPRPPTAMSPRT